MKRKVLNIKNRSVLNKKKSGRKKGDGIKLSLDDRRYIIDYLTSNTPCALENKSVLWTRKSVRKLINGDLHIEISKSSIGSYFYSMDLVTDRSTKNVYRDQNRKTKEWMWDEYPNIKKRAQKQNAVVWWGNLKVVKQKESRRVNKPFLKEIKYIMLYVVINNGVNMFSLYSHKTLTNIDLIDFLCKIINTADKKVFLLLPIRKVYPVKEIKNWLLKHHDEIELIYVPLP